MTVATPMTNALGEIIRENRYQRGWTQAELASKLGTHQTNVSNMETRLTEAYGREKINKLLTVFNYPADLVLWWVNDQLSSLEGTLSRATFLKKKTRVRPQSEEIWDKLNELIDQSRNVYTELAAFRDLLRPHGGDHVEAEPQGVTADGD